MNFPLIALVSFLVGSLMTTLGIVFFPKMGLMDRPERYGLKRKPIPYYGGILIFATFLISIILTVPITANVIGLLIGSFIIVLVGFLDDKYSLSPVLRLGMQVLAAMCLIVFGIGILSITNPLGGVIDLNLWQIDLSFIGIGTVVPIVGALFTIVWIVLITNTMNFLDGVPGLTSGISFIAALTIFFLSIRPDIHQDVHSQVTVAAIALIVAFAAFAFLIFDFPKPKILMGDSGSTFFGFVLATLAIFSGGKVATAFLVLGIPILDASWTVIRRLMKGKKPWEGDLEHLHHKLLDLGVSARGVLLILYTLSVVFGVLAVVCTSSKQKLFIMIGLGILMGLLLLALLFTSKRRK